MSPENVKFVKEIAKAAHPNKAMELRLDNNFIVNERLQYVHWDDEHDLVFSIERNESPTTGRDRPFKMVIQDYDQIQDITITLQQSEFEAAARKAGYTDEQIKHIMRSLVFTKEDFADSVSNQVKGRRHDVVAD